VLRNIRWSSLGVVLGGAALALVCLGAALRGHPWAWLVGVVCAATAVREVRALRRLDGRVRGARAGRRDLGTRGDEPAVRR
jgi:hypothetical protein